MFSFLVQEQGTIILLAQKISWLQPRRWS